MFKKKQKMADFTTQLNNINAQRTAFEQAQKQLNALQIKRLRGENITPAAIQTARTQLAAAKTQVQTNINTLHQGQTLDALVKNWEADIPLLMLPLRIQTRIVANPQPTDTTFFSLLVRIYPDDIFMCSHEETLTDAEVVAAKIYWNTLRESEQTGITKEKMEEMKKEAWRQLCTLFGGGRSLFVTKKTTPLNRADFSTLATPDAIKYDAAVISQTKPKSWSEAAKTGLMPDRFQVLVFNHTSETVPAITQNGNLIPDTLTIGLNPIEEGSQLKKNKGELTVGEDILWMTDFAAAEKVGMGLRIPLPLAFYFPAAVPFNPNQGLGQARYLQILGIRRIVVVGVLNSADKTKSADLLQKTMENHLFTRKSLAFLEKGTPTNNTDDSNSAWSSANDPLSKDYFDGVKNYPDTDSETDGARLSQALGLPKSVFQNTPKSAKRDYDTAQKLNTAVYNASLGYYFEQLMTGVVPNTAELKKFFQQYVVGGGNYAALRVGYQPYGIALAGDYKKLGQADTAVFYKDLTRVLSSLDGIWNDLATKTPRIGEGTNPAETLTNVLSLHAQSQSFEQQWFYPTDAMTVEKVPGFDKTGIVNKSLIKGYLASLGLTADLSPVLAQLVTHIDQVSTKLSIENVVKPDVFDYDDPLPILSGSAISINANFNYLQWLSSVESLRDLETLPLGSRAEMAALLFLFLRQALLIQIEKAVLNFVRLPIFKAGEADKATPMLKQLPFLSFNIPVLPASRVKTSWEYLNVSLALDEAHPAIGAKLATLLANKSIGDMVLSKTLTTSLVKNFGGVTALRGGDVSQIAELLSLRKAMASLADMPAAVLEKTFLGHLDCASHRLDAWQEGLIARRLDQNRQKKPQGIYVGAFGWVEGLKMTNNPAQTGGGFIHAPSPTHATAAAVLKSAFLNHKQDNGQSAFALNLHSNRLQKAEQVLERMQSGERLETILGYQFERELNDVSSAAAATIVDFRRIYRVMTTQLPQNPNQMPTEIASTQNIVNGLSLLEDADWQRKVGVDAVAKPFVQKAIDNLADTLDAVKDLLAAETAYRMAQGNFDAVGATLDGLSKGKMPHDLGFTQSARQDLLQFTNRVALHFDTEGVPIDFPNSPRAKAEAGLNKWCGQLLGNLQTISCLVKHELPTLTAAGVAAESANARMTVVDLGLQALDFVCLSANPSELELRIRYAYRQRLNLADSTVVKISFAESGAPSLRPFAQIFPFASTIHRLITASRPLTAQDYLPKSGSETPSVIEVAELRGRIEMVLNDLKTVLDNIKNINLAQTRVLQDGTILSKLGDVFTVLKKVKHEATSDDWLPSMLPNTTDLQGFMIQLAGFGIAKAFPERRDTSGASAVLDLVRQAATVVDTTEQMLLGVQTNLQTLTAQTTVNLTFIENLIRHGKQALSGTMPMLPRFRYANIAQITEANRRRPELLVGSPNDPTPADMKAEEWLQSVARVRPKLAVWESLRFMASHLSLDLLPVQVPLDALNLMQPDGSKKPIYTWLATEFTEGVRIRKEAVSIVATGDVAAKTAQLQTGLLLDDWTEAVPNDEELTALTFHYNQPNAEAPQTLLLAVCPDATWSWDAVVASVTETLRRAKLRTVNLSKIKDEAHRANTTPNFKALDQLLPLLVAPVNAQQHTNTLDYGMMDAVQRKKMTDKTDPLTLGHYQIWQE